MEKHLTGDSLGTVPSGGPTYPDHQADCLPEAHDRLPPGSSRARAPAGPRRQIWGQGGNQPRPR
eukprot:1438672-Pyramimonas_sp.AAC.1